MLSTETIEAEPDILARDSGRTGPAAEHGGALAREIGATGHAVFTVARGARGRELVCLLGSEFPRLSPAAAGRLVGAATDAIRPLWWAHHEAQVSGGPRWATRLKGPLPGPAGLALPVAVEPEAQGLVAFVGPRLSLSDRALPEFHRKCFALFGEIAACRCGSARETAALAKRELECIRLAADGLTSEDIARALGLSLHTANQYLAEAARKLNASGRMHAVAKALRLGLID